MTTVEIDDETYEEIIKVGMCLCMLWGHVVFLRSFAWRHACTWAQT